jgi:hypothetical protein
VALLWHLLVAATLGACVSADRLPDAIGAWRGGAEHRALSLARAEYERFRDGNDLDEREVALDRAQLLEVLRSPLVLTGDEAESRAREDDGLLRGELATMLGRDLRSLAAMRVARAVQAVARLGIARHGPDLLAIIWRREPFALDHDSLGALGTARRSVLVKRLALDALVALAGHPR